MKEFVLLLALGLFAPLATAYGYGSLAPPGGYYHARKTYASFAAWCVDFACTKDETYTYYNSVPFNKDREKCNCQCPSPENGEVYYPVLMDYRLLLTEAHLLHNDSVSDLKNYCPWVTFKDREIKINAWNVRVAVGADSLIFDWNPFVPCHYKAFTGLNGSLVLTRVIVDTLKKFSVVIICLNNTKMWVVHSPYQKRLESGSEKYILELLQKMNMDTSRIFRPDFSQCGGGSSY